MPNTRKEHTKNEMIRSEQENIAKWEKEKSLNPKTCVRCGEKLRFHLQTKTTHSKENDYRRDEEGVG